MRRANAATVALLASGQPFEQFDMYTFTLASGFVARYVNCPFDVNYGGNTWLCSRTAGGVILDEAGDTPQRGDFTDGFAVGQWAIRIMPRDTDTIGNLPWKSAVRAGILNEAIMQVDRGIIAAWPSPPTLAITPVGILSKYFFGRVAEIDWGRSAVDISANDPRELLAIDFPRNFWTAECGYALFDTRCTLVKATFAVPTTINGIGNSNSKIMTTDAAHADNYFALGSALITSGDNTGLQLRIQSSLQLAGAIQLAAPFPFLITPGTTVTLYPGCDKQATTCTNKFNNRPNFGGFKDIPAPETAI